MKAHWINGSFFMLCLLLVTAAQPSHAQTERNRPSVDVIRLSETTVYDTTYYGARLEPKTSDIQKAPFSGTVISVFVTEGQQVRSGTALYSITRSSQISTGDYVPLTVRAVKSGVITSVKISAGDEIDDKSETMTISDISSLKAVIYVSDKDITSVQKGMECYIPKENNFKGVITKIAVIPDTKSGLFETEIEFKNSRNLFPGRFVTIEIPMNPVTGIFIPGKSIVSRYGKKFVYIIEDNKARMQEIEILKTAGTEFLVSGLKTGEMLAVSNTRFLSDGTEVTPSDITDAAQS